MSINTAHANNGVLIHSGEYILLFSDNVLMEFPGRDEGIFKGTKPGRIYLTSHRMIFNSKTASEPLQSFSFPFVTLTDVDIEQPVFGANYIKGKVTAQENGNFQGQAKFKLLFKSGGAIDFGQAMVRAASMAQRNAHNQAPPPYSPPTGSWYQAPPPAYTPNPQQGYYGWVPPASQNFQTGPPADGVFMTDNPPPYPGILPSGPSTNPIGYPAASPGYSNGYPGYPNQPATGGYQGAPGYSNYTGGAGGFPSPQQPGGYPGAPPVNYPQPGGYPNAMGFANSPPANSKEAEAAQSAYYDPNQPQTAYVPPPAYYEPPPSYNSLANKKGQ
jgi:hypothetical protein